MTKILSMNLKFEYDWKILEELKNNLPFTDEYFEFNQKDIVSLFYFNELLNVLFTKVASFDVSCFDSSTTYSHIYNFLVNNGIIWLLLIKSLASDWFNERLERFGFYDYNIIDIINNTGRIHEIAELYDFNLNNFADVMLTHDVGINASDRAVAILGFDVILKLCGDTEYTAKSSNEIVKMAEELMCNAVKMSNKTVPYVSGKTMNYQYSLYDWQNSDILLAGIDTKACFRIDGADNDFLHYCILDKNGFVIKITDNFGNFIARASGFRNGNSLYINQLRTVYDIGDNCYVGLMRNECDEIIEVFKLACDDIIKKSHDNQEEKHKIEHIFINRSYAMEYYPSDDINSDVQNYIGDCPMDNYSEDWEEFINSSNNLDCKEEDDYFVTDYGNYPIICISSVKDINSLNVDDLKMYDAKSFYERKRNKVLLTNEFNEETCNKINRIRAIYAHFNDEKYEPINKLNSKIILIGDNWYIIYDGNKIIDSCYILEDERARREFICATGILTNYSTNIDTKNYEVLTNRINEQIKENAAKKLIKTLK